MAQHHRVHELLSREELDELEAFAREPARTVDECLKWLKDKQPLPVSRSAVGRWKQAFDAEDRFRAASDAARGLMATAASDEKGAVAIADAAALKINQMIFEQMLKAQEDGAIDTADLLRLAQAHRHGILAKRDVERVRQEMTDRQRSAAEEARKVADAGGSAAQVVAVIQKAFGIG